MKEQQREKNNTGRKEGGVKRKEEEELIKELIAGLNKKKEEKADLLKKGTKETAGYIPEGYEKKSLVWEWNPEKQGGVPSFIEIEGEKKEIQYFQGGIIKFIDGSSATYERIIDEEDKQKIEVFYASKVKKEKEPKKSKE